MELRRAFDRIPAQFDRWRPRYCAELFADLTADTGLGPGRAVLELGLGTGQATGPVLDTGCDYLGIELGEHLAAYAENRFRAYPNFRIVNADYETYDFGAQKFDLIYSAATIQWLPEEIAFGKTFGLLRSGGTLAMMMTHTDERSADPALFDRIQAVYARYFHPEMPYTCKLDYTRAGAYGFSGPERRDYYKTRTLNADEYVSYIGTHCTHITLREPERTLFFEGVRDAVRGAGDRIVLRDEIVLYLAKKPWAAKKTGLARGRRERS